MGAPSVLLIDDDDDSLQALRDWVESHGLKVDTTDRLEDARTRLRSEQPYDLVIVDQVLADGSGLALLPELEDRRETEIVVLAADADVEAAVEAFRGGAIDYLEKPLDLKRLRRIVSDVVRAAEFREQIADLRDDLRSLGRFGRMVGASKAMHEVYDQILKVAPTDAAVFILGETGTGKELVAETVHGLSSRSKAPFVPVNCGAIAETLIESELFGHEKGAFTGAARRHQGFFERARGGTLFLDEITEMPLELQVKLLRALESGRIRRVGGTEVIDVDVRIVAASNRDPHAAVADGHLREDLLYRLLVFPIELPSLREREGDIEILANAFLTEFNRDRDARPLRLSDEALDALEAHPWPGNVRELRHAIEGASIRAIDRIRASDLPFVESRFLSDPRAVEDEGTRGDWPRVGTSIAETERTLILATVEAADGDKKAAARTLGISLKTLYNRLRQYRGE